jgi:hypothetical protein
VKSFLLCLAVIGLSIAFGSARAFAQTSPPPMEGTPPASSPMPPPPAPSAAPRLVGGHIGLAIPFVTFHVAKPSTQKGTTSISDDFVLATPIGVSVHTAPDYVVDFEVIVANHVHPYGPPTELTIDPGIVYTGGPVNLGLRVKFDILHNANVGIIPLVNKGIADLGFGTWFAEVALPITAEKQAGGSITLVVHTGIGF